METTEKNQIDIHTFKIIPEHLGKGFGFCVYGETSEEVLELAKECNFKVEPAISAKGHQYTDFFPTEKTDFTKMFPAFKKFKYMDGFSPNLNKHLHIGHFSNLVIAKAFQSLEVAEVYFSILGDTLSTEVSLKAEALAKFAGHCITFEYKSNPIYFASEMVYKGDLLKDGEGDYAGTKIVEIGEEKIVVIKQDGSTSYFYQDLALASELNESTLYLTGYEQENHFNTLKKIYPHIHHVGLGLLRFQTRNEEGSLEDDKMSTRLGNVIFLDDFLKDLQKKFNDDIKLCYNIFAGYILKNNPKSDKMFNADTMENPKNSPGLYLSYTMARLKSAGVPATTNENFIKQFLTFNYLKSKHSLNPKYLFDALIDLCNQINQLYGIHQISENEKNKEMFSVLLGDLSLGMKKLGLFEIDKV